MKKYLLKLFLLISLASYSQNATIGNLDAFGARKVTFTNPAPIVVDGTIQATGITGYGRTDGRLNILFKGGSGTYTYIWTKENEPTFTSPPDWQHMAPGKYTITAKDGKGCFSLPQSFEIEDMAQLKVTITGNKILCNGANTGTLSVVTTEGGLAASGYNYEWFKKVNNAYVTTGLTGLTGAKELLAGTYVVYATDKATTPNFAWSNEFTIEQPLLPLTIVQQTQKNVSCNGGNDGTITLNISGGTAGYSIVWDDITIPYIAGQPNRTGLSIGKYNYTVKDSNNCTIPGLSEIEITQPDKLLIASITQIQPSGPAINDGQIAVNVTGGTPNYSYILKKGSNPDVTYGSNVINGLGNGSYTVLVKDANNCTVTSGSILLQALEVNPDKQVNVKCHGDKTGSITVIASGGTIAVNSKYKYQWYKESQLLNGETDAEIKNIGKGDYTVTVKDDKNTTVTSIIFNITEPSAALTATESHTDVVCFGESNGTITLNIQGGTPPYTVVWKDVNDAAKNVIVTQLPKGTYSYTITDNNGCTFPSPQNITINQNSAITITSITQKQPTTATATDGEITINVTGGNGGYTYMLKKNNITTSYTASPITGLGDGVYEVSVKDNKNCTTAIQTITLKALAVALVSKVDVTCYGANTGSIEVLASGGTPIAPNQYTYTWFYKQKATDTYLTLASQTTNKAVNLYAGFYKVIVTDNVNISREVEFAELTQRPAITCTFTKTEVNCFNGNDGTITLNIGGGTGAYTVTWKDVNDAAKTVNPTQLTAGNYTFSITDANGCIFPTTPVAITQPLKALEISLLNKVDASGFGLLNGSLEVVAVDGTGPYTYQWYQGAAKTIMTGKTNPLLNGIGAGDYTVVATDKNLCKKDMTFTVLQPAELLITAINEIESIKCNTYKEAVLKATISGGAPIGVADADKNYIYKWYNELQPTVVVSTTNPSETLVAGRYFLVVSDGFGNSYTSTKVTVSEPTPIKITYTQTNVSCKNQQDGSIHITTTGGTGAHTITWSKTSDPDPNSISNLFAGNYSVTVRDANNCTATQNFIITEPEILAINKVVKTPPSAEGVDDASIAVTVQGGTANYNFQWYDQNMNLIYTDNNKASNTSIYNIYAGQYFISVTDANGCQITMRDLDKVDPLFIDVVQINSVQCHGDATASIKALTSGGLPGYTYKWYEITNPAVVVGQAETLINAKAGTYYVIATDSFNKSIQSQNITITEPTLLTNSLSAEYVRCGDGNDWTIVSNVQEGTAPYTYLWNTGAKTPNLVNTVSGNYTLIVTDKNGCIVVKSINLVTPEHLNATKVIKIPTCYGGSDATIVVTTHAGIAPFTYLWNTGEKSNTLSNATAGTYSVEITDSKGCIIIETYIIENPPKDVIDLGQDVTLCFDQTLTINATIADDQATYSWTSDKGFKSNKAMITVSEPANYTVVVTNKLGCQATDTIKISSQNTAISAEFAVSSQVFKNEKIIVVDISNPANDEIEWVLPANAKVYSKDKDYAELSFDTIGEYEITLNTKKGNCTATQTKQILVTEGEYEDPDSEINPNEKKFDLKIYPNPSKGIFTVDVTLDKAMKASIKVYNLSNNKLIDSKTEDGRDNYLFDFNLSSLPTGIYFVLFESQQGNKLRKIIIQ